MAQTRIVTTSSQPFFIEESVADVVADINDAEEGDWIVVTRAGNGNKLAIKASEVTWIGEADES